jgi:signal transduction histidine kinase
LPDQGKEYVDRILASAARMRRLIDDLLSLSRVTTQKRPFRRLDLSKLVGEVVSDLDVRLAQTGGTVHVGPLPPIEADPTQMRQLFQNLIANAIKYTPRGAVVVAAQVLDAAGAVECRVSDDGAGIPEELLEKIFDKGETDAEKEGGAGLGLAIVKAFTEAHGGKVTVESKEGVGSTFRFSLPTKANAGGLTNR